MLTFSLCFINLSLLYEYLHKTYFILRGLRKTCLDIMNKICIIQLQCEFIFQTRKTFYITYSSVFL